MWRRNYFFTHRNIYHMKVGIDIPKNEFICIITIYLLYETWRKS